MIVRRLASTDPLFYARRLRQRPRLALLDSAMRHEVLGRYSFVACDPFGLFEVREGRALWNGEALEGEPLAALRTLLARYPQQARADLPPFQGGALGYVGYEFGSALETLPRLGDGDDIARDAARVLRRRGRHRPCPRPCLADFDRVARAGPRQAARAGGAARRRFAAWLEASDRQTDAFRPRRLRSAASLGVQFRPLRLRGGRRSGQGPTSSTATSSRPTSPSASGPPVRPASIRWHSTSACGPSMRPRSRPSSISATRGRVEFAGALSEGAGHATSRRGPSRERRRAAAIRARMPKRSTPCWPLKRTGPRTS